jgi:MFS family permease
MSDIKEKNLEQAPHTSQDNGSDIIIPLKMAQIRTSADNWTVYIGFLVLGLGSSIIGTSLYGIDWTISSAFKAFDISPAVSVASDLLNIILIPLLAALSDVYGRGIIMAGSWVLTIIGEFMHGAAPDFGVYSAAGIIGGFGDTGTDLIAPIIFADFLRPRNRGFGFILQYLPSFIALGVSIPIIKATENTDQWRILFYFRGAWIFVFCIPLLYVLFRLQNRARGLLPSWDYNVASLRKVDWIGLSVLVVGLGCFLTPFNFYQRWEEGWAAPAIFVPIAIGCILFVAFFVWEIKYTKRPLISYRLLANKGAMIMILVRAFGTFDGNFTWYYMHTYLSLTRDIKPHKVTEIYLGFRISWYLSGFIIAFVLRKYPYVRPYVWGSILIHGIGNGLAIASRHPTSPTWFVILAEAVIGFGGGVTSCVGLVVLQSTVEFVDIASIIAFDSLVGNVFGSIAYAVANAVWNGSHWKNLEYYLPEDLHELIPDLLSSNEYNELIPEEFKSNWLQAMTDSQWLMCSISLGFSALCLLLSLLLPSIDLEKCQKIIEANQAASDSEEFNEKI